MVHQLNMVKLIELQNLSRPRVSIDQTTTQIVRDGQLVHQRDREREEPPPQGCWEKFKHGLFEVASAIFSDSAMKWHCLVLWLVCLFILLKKDHDTFDSIRVMIYAITLISTLLATIERKTFFLYPILILTSIESLKYGLILFLFYVRHFDPERFHYFTEIRELSFFTAPIAELGPYEVDLWAFFYFLLLLYYTIVAITAAERMADYATDQELHRIHRNDDPFHPAFDPRPFMELEVSTPTPVPNPFLNFGFEPHPDAPVDSPPHYSMVVGTPPKQDDTGKEETSPPRYSQAYPNRALTPIPECLSSFSASSCSTAPSSQMTQTETDLK